VISTASLATRPRAVWFGADDFAVPCAPQKQLSPTILWGFDGFDPAEPTEPTDPWADLSNQELLDAIQTFTTTGKHVLKYSAARAFIFTKLDNHEGKVRCVYTGREVVTKTVPNENDMNIEHTWPQSRGASGVAKSDMHHLFPTDSKANSVRANYPFGEVVEVRWEQGGSKFGLDAQGNEVFEPPEEHKGNVARALFYFSATYDKHIDEAEETVLQQWADADVVDEAERERNDLIAEAQKSRNPFIDHPDLSDRIADF
jgi:deoxyribonuclease I